MIIGLIGNKRVGKDTCADILVNKYDFIKLAFADPIKDVAKVLFDLDVNNDNKKEEITEYGISLREFYQKFGTELMQKDIYKYFPNMEFKIPKKMFWIIKLFNKIESYKKKGYQHFVISDVRFIHEANYIKKNGGILIKISRTTNQIDNHISEQETQLIKDIDLLINNNKTLTELETNLDINIKKFFDNCSR